MWQVLDEYLLNESFLHIRFPKLKNMMNAQYFTRVCGNRHSQTLLMGI